MPELPDVEVLKRYLDATCLHQRIQAVQLDAPRMLRSTAASSVRDALSGSAFEATKRHGKFLLVQLDPEPWLVLHFGMTGTLNYYPSDGEPPPHTRLLVRFETGYCLAGSWQWRLGRIDLTASQAAFVQQEGLGCDACDPSIDAQTLGRMLNSRHGSVKSALMDQGFIAGIGNVYGDEILFQAGVRPDAKANELNERRCGELHRAIGHVLQVAIERQAKPDRLPQGWLLQHRQQGEHCPRCGGQVKRMG